MGGDSSLSDKSRSPSTLLENFENVHFFEFFQFTERIGGDKVPGTGVQPPVIRIDWIRHHWRVEEIVAMVTAGAGGIIGFVQAVRSTAAVSRQ